jgi:hypothetical protein
MTYTQQVHHEQSQKGPLDDLNVVNRLSEDAADQSTTDQTKPTESPSTDTSKAAQPDLTAGSLEVVDETACHSVAVKDFRHYLFLAEELKHSRERAREKFYIEQLSKELGLDEIHANDQSKSAIEGTALVKPSVILKQLELREISLEDWEKVTASASISDLLRAARSMKALELGLPKDATEEQIERRCLYNSDDRRFEAALADGLAKSDLVNTASRLLNDIRNNPRQYTAYENRGSVELFEKEIDLLSDKFNRRVSETADRSVLCLPASAVIAASTGVWFAVSNARNLVDSVMGISLLGGIGLTIGAFVGVALVGLAQELLVVPQLKQKLLAEISNSPSMQEVTKELENMGVKCRTSLVASRRHNNNWVLSLRVKLYIPKE